MPVGFLKKSALARELSESSLSFQFSRFAAGAMAATLVGRKRDMMYCYWLVGLSMLNCDVLDFSGKILSRAIL